MIACPRCKAGNDPWESFCKSCGLPFDAAWRANAEGSAERRAAAKEAKRDEAPAAPPGVEHAAHHQSLAQLLGIEVAHAEALADAGIHTLEHIAESVPQQIGHALRAWSHIDPAALIARAQQLLRHRAQPPDTKPLQSQAPAKPEPKAVPREPDPTEWWKMT